MTLHSTKGNGGKSYRYNLSTRDSKEGHGASHLPMLPAREVDEGVMAQVCGLLRLPEMVALVWREIAILKDKATAGINETQVAVALNQTERVMDQLFPLEWHSSVQLVIEKGIVAPNELQVKLQPGGVENLTLDVIRDSGRVRPAKATPNVTTWEPRTLIVPTPPQPSIG